jgi:phthalate 4,5-dioxygenase oxygenase subunit
LWIHVSVLDQSWLQTAGDKKASLEAAGADQAPVYEFQDMPGGFRYAAIRKVAEDRRYIRVTAFVAPWYCFIPFNTGNCVISVPIDDENTALYFVHYNKDGPVAASAYGPTSTPGDWPPYLKAGAEAHWGQDRDAMKRGSFTGFTEHFMLEDFAVAASQGTIADRSTEFLNVGDRAILQFRRLLINSVKEFQVGTVPAIAHLENVPYPTIRAYGEVVNKDTEWRSYFT